ncbi:MAG TPA: ABC transporter ATP-binding protein [bacterium]|nr:ABC transporter ATP-binding protein [bacterium]
MSALIELRGVSKLYLNRLFQVNALRNIDLNIQPAEFAVVDGPSGSGKSTLLHLIGALDRPTQGQIVVGEQDLGRLSKNQLSEFRLKKVGFVFQTHNLVWALTALENIEYPLLLLGVERKERREKAFDLLQRVGLSDQSDKRPGEMSGGQRQRISVARAIVTNPAIVLGDEPTANLDSRSAVDLINLFFDLNRQFKTTFLIATHDRDIMKKADRNIRLHDGMVVNS